MRRAAIQALASMNTDEARAVLGDAMSDRDPVIRNVATRAYCPVAGPQPLKVRSRLRRSEDDGVRHEDWPRRHRRAVS